MSDGPGYIGAVEIVIGWGEVRLRLDGREDRVGSVAQPADLNITGWRIGTAQDCQQLWPYLDQATKEHFEAPVFIERERVIWLDLADGGRAAVMLGGEPGIVQFFDLREKAGTEDASVLWEFD